MTSPTQQEILASLGRFAPTPATVASEWARAHQTATLQQILGVGHDEGAASEVVEIPLQFVPAHTPTRHWLSGRAAAASVAVLVAGATAGLLALVSSSPPSQQAGDGGPTIGAVFDPPAGLSDKAIGTGQYSYRVYEQIDVNAAGVAEPNGPDAMVDREWVSPNGDIVSWRTGSQNSCHTFPLDDPASMSNPDQSFFAALPTDVEALNSYLRGHVEGSSSLDEGVFTAVGDALRSADGLASPRLRAAFVAVLSRTTGVTVRENATDYLGRPAIRADFLDQPTRPGEVQSLYFDPTTFQLTGTSESKSGLAPTYDGPSPAYTSARSPINDPDVLTGTTYVEVMRSETVVDTLPSTLPPSCR